MFPVNRLYVVVCILSADPIINILWDRFINPTSHYMFFAYDRSYI